MSKFRLFGLSVGVAIVTYGMAIFQPLAPPLVLVGLALISFGFFLYGLYKVIRDLTVNLWASPPPSTLRQKENPNNRLYVPDPRYK